MENQRLFVWAALGLVLWLNYIAWQRDYAPTPLPAAATTTAPASNGPSEALPELPAADGTPPTPAATAAQPATEATTSTAPVVRVVTDVLDMEISTRGGELQRAELLKYPKVKNQPDVPVR